MEWVHTIPSEGTFFFNEAKYINKFLNPHTHTYNFLIIIQDKYFLPLSNV